MYTSTYPSPLGPLTLQSDGEALTGLWTQDQKYFGGGQPLGEEARDELPLFDLARRWLDAYFAGQRPKPEALPLRPAGSPFRQAVFQILIAIPYGQLSSYGEIARRLTAQGGRPASAQAVGGAVGHNPISLIIPCHRVVGAGGSLTGYAGGIERKVWLLQHEGADMSGLYVPARGTAL